MQSPNSLYWFTLPQSMSNGFWIPITVLACINFLDFLSHQIHFCGEGITACFPHKMFDLPWNLESPNSLPKPSSCIWDWDWSFIALIQHLVPRLNGVATMIFQWPIHMVFLRERAQQDCFDCLGITWEKNWINEAKIPCLCSWINEMRNYSRGR